MLNAQNQEEKNNIMSNKKRISKRVEALLKGKKKKQIFTFKFTDSNGDQWIAMCK